jgi:hypothetical protein
MAARNPIEITKDNDLLFRAGPIRGRNPVTDAIEDYPGSSCQGWLATAADSDTALGSVLKTFTKVGTNIFLPFFEASEVNTALAAVTGLTDGQSLWCVLKAAGDFRVASELVYRVARLV